jgi:adenylate kinase family enzyme
MRIVVIGTSGAGKTTLAAMAANRRRHDGADRRG